jgi:hypothetical protein
MKNLVRFFAVGIVAACLMAGVAAQSQASVSGKWRMTVTFPQQPAAGTLVLKVEGERVTGTLDAGFAGGSIPIEGEFSHGMLTFSGSTASGPHPGLQLDFTAKLNDDKLAGTFSWQVGDFPWTAERAQ